MRVSHCWDNFFTSSLKKKKNHILSNLNIFKVFICHFFFIEVEMNIICDHCKEEKPFLEERPILQFEDVISVFPHMKIKMPVPFFCF